MLGRGPTTFTTARQRIMLPEVCVLCGPPPSPDISRGPQDLAKIARVSATFAAFWTCRCRGDAVSAQQPEYFEENLCRPLAGPTLQLLRRFVLCGPTLMPAVTRNASGK